LERSLAPEASQRAMKVSISAESVPVSMAESWQMGGEKGRRKE
jgi:hypothetical protein